MTLKTEVKILRLPETAINQIAAGEVVENPASVIKELIENSLDAGASHITIRIEKGGQSLIEVEDNGEGMSKEDALLSLERHATSKIRSAEDLLNLATMGFRGEALAAITAVSYFEMKTSNSFDGTHIRGKGGVVEEVMPCARNQGTTLSIRSLFFNTPARKKFQKSIASSTAHVTKVVELMALGNPSVSFSYISQGETIYSLEAQTQKERIEALLGDFEYTAENERFWGVFGAPNDATPRRKQYLFVNKRPVFSPLVSKAVQVAYGTRLKESMHPPFALFLELDAKNFDINVHPQKKEIRFSNESSLFSQVEHFVTKNLFSKPLASRDTIFFDSPPSFALTDVPEIKTYEEQTPFDFELPAKPLTVFGKYLLLEKEGLLLIDLSRARARVFFEKMSTKIESQALLLPLEIEETDPEVLASLEKMGFSCRQISPRITAIDAIPQVLDLEEVVSFIALWKEGKSLETVSASFSLRSDRRYSIDGAMHLWGELQKCNDAVFDPLGKRIWKKLESKDLEAICR